MQSYSKQYYGTAGQFQQIVTDVSYISSSYGEKVDKGER
jgi:hypothetical protein